MERLDRLRAMWDRLRALVIKELLAVTRDPRSRVVLIAPPVIQLLLFSFAATLEVTRIDVMVLNQDAGHWSRELIARIEGAPAFKSVGVVTSRADLEDAILRQRAMAVVQIGPTFSRDLEAGQPTQVQIILDGRKSNASQIVAGYLTRIVQGVGADINPPGPAAFGPTVTTEVRNWFNPNLDEIWYMVPSLVCVIALLMGLIVTALSIAREREMGTFDQLMVSPLRTGEILLGKVLPPMMIGLGHITIFVLVAVFLFGIPLRGSVALLYLASVFFLFATVGVGLFISAASATQQQAILGAFVFMVPAMILSGFVTPIENMPEWLQPVTYANPMRYFLVIVKGLFLKDLPTSDVLMNIFPLGVIGIVTMSASAWLFRHRQE